MMNSTHQPSRNNGRVGIVQRRRAGICSRASRGTPSGLSRLGGALMFASDVGIQTVGGDLSMVVLIDGTNE